MQKITTEVKIGIFVVVAVALLGYMTFKIGDFKFGREKGYVINGSFENVSGLYIKAPVKMAGVTVGAVETINLDDSKARVGMRIRPDVKIRKDSLVAIKSESLLGEKYVELIQGKEKELLKEGDTIYKSVSVADLDSLITQLYNIAEDVRSVSGFFRETFGSRDTKDTVKDIMKNLRDLTENLANLTERNSEAIDRIVMDLTELIGQIKGMTEENRAPLRNSLANLERISDELSAMTKENREPLRITMTNMQELSTELKDKAPQVMGKIDTIVGRIERGEGTVGKLMKEEGFYEKLDSTLAGINKYITAADRFRLNLGFRGEYLMDEDDTKGYFSLKMQPREDKYYLFEVIDDPRGRTKITDTEVTTTPDGSTIITHEVKTEDQLKLSALFAKKFGSVAFRGGLMEDTFGIGADYYIINEQLRASVDAWNFDGNAEATNPHMKFTANYTVFKTLFLNVGVDDFVNSKKSSSFAGAGLSFDDEDLKYLMTRLPISMP
ncbi:MAG: outer membrane lipid asymmetry maintenance protein MlaD [Nitrospirae bacterium]|nr:outer membrane lipid asymmetry maintenance protein MlaD [Nitrospirota bacterium]